MTLSRSSPELFSGSLDILAEVCESSCRQLERLDSVHSYQVKAGLGASAAGIELELRSKTLDHLKHVESESRRLRLAIQEHSSSMGAFHLVCWLQVGIGTLLLLLVLATSTPISELSLLAILGAGVFVVASATIAALIRVREIVPYRGLDQKAAGLEARARSILEQERKVSPNYTSRSTRA